MDALATEAVEEWHERIEREPDDQKVALRDFHERVALGFIIADDNVLWYGLPNTAELNPDGRGEFFVEGDAIKRALEDAHARMVEQGVFPNTVPIVLWHTHVNTVEPSAEDIAEFPTWLADIGMVFHVPTQTVTLYNVEGILPTEGDFQPALATSE